MLNQDLFKIKARLPTKLSHKLLFYFIDPIFLDALEYNV